jgi:predicted NBD/HSP70 family sugar kinase
MKLTEHEKNVVQAVFGSPKPTRRTIAEYSGISLVVATSAIKSLTNKGLLSRTPLPQNRSGRPEFMYHLTNEFMVTVGISVTTDSFHLVGMGLNKDLVLDRQEHLEIDTDSGSQSAFLDRLSERVRQILADTPQLEGKLVSIGITLPGLINSTEGIWLNGLQIPGIHQFDLGAYMQRQFVIPYVIEDVSRALTFYEKTVGLGVGVDHFVLLSLGLGTGSGVVINHELYQGFNGLAGEIGHTVVQPDGYRDVTGMVGTLETLASVSGVLRVFRDRLADGVASSLKNLAGNGYADLTLRAIYEAACNGDRLTKGILFEIGGYIGEACTKVIKILNPRKLIISGPVSLLKEFMNDAIRQTIEHKVLPEMLSGFSLEYAAYEPNQEAVGMALLAMQRYLDQPFMDAD